MIKTYYLHTINEKPAYFIPDYQLCFITRNGEAGSLATSLRQIRREQKFSVKKRQDIGIAEDGSRYSYRRIRL